MALKTIIENLTKARADYDRQLKEIGDNAAKAIAEYLAPNIPAGFCVGWNQYTPYFNDGEACTFRVGDFWLVKSDARKCPRYEEEGNDDEPEDQVRLCLGAWVVTRYDLEPPKAEPGRYQAQKVEPLEGAPRDLVVTLSDALNSLPEDMLKSAFGDHQRIRVFSDGTYVTDEHDHD